MISPMNFLCWKLPNLYHKLRPLWTLDLAIQLSNRYICWDVSISKIKLLVYTSKPALPTILLKKKKNSICLKPINKSILSFPLLMPKKKSSVIFLFVFSYTFSLSSHTYLSPSKYAWCLNTFHHFLYSYPNTGYHYHSLRLS